MPFSKSDQSPVQKPFTVDNIRSMKVGRRQLKTEWPETLYPPSQPSENWKIILPFANTYENAFRSMCEIEFRAHPAKDGLLIIFLNGTGGDSEAPADAIEWVEKVGYPVAMKDFLAISFALDYDRHGGNPQEPQTEIGALRAQAKPYGDSAATAQTNQAADKLVEHCMKFLNNMGWDCIVAMPPSDPLKTYNLPRDLAKRIANEWGREDLSKHVTGKARNSIKKVPLANKLDTLLGTINVAEGVFHDRKVLLLDDLYQSGVSINYCGNLLLQAGAMKIFGLACEKT